VSGTALTLTIGDEGLDAIAERVAEILRQRHRAEGPTAQFASAAVGASPFLTVAEAAEYLRAKRQRVYDLLSCGRLTRYKDGAGCSSRAPSSTHTLPEGLRVTLPRRCLPAHKPLGEKRLRSLD
jgi:excisionase family DNA binding protein